MGRFWRSSKTTVVCLILVLVSLSVQPVLGLAMHLQYFCLEHSGPQDKPLPTLCFVNGHTALAQSSQTNIIQIKTPKVDAIQKLATGLHQANCLGDYGAYVSQESPVIVICRAEMKIFLRQVKKLVSPLPTTALEALLLRI
jgi:hypothetical protein